MNTHTDSPTNPRATGGASSPAQRPAASRRFLTAGLIAVVTLVIALVWVAAVAVPRSDRIQELPRAGIPGEVTVTVTEPSDLVVYYERRSWFAATPMNPPVVIDVTGPEGRAIPVDPYETPVHYRLPGLVGEAVATFPADGPGDYTLAVDATAALPEDARAAVGPNVTAQILGGLLGPVILLAIGLAAAAVVAGRAATTRR